jgi:hypothetical protein
MQSVSVNHPIPVRPLAAPIAPESLSPLARLALLLAVCAGSWTLLLGLGYGAVRLL